MPKQADIRVQIPGLTAAQFWEVVYENPAATERYHTSFNASTETSVSPWSSCQRTVNFTMPLKLPDFLKRMVGLDSVAVTEVQRVVWHGGSSFTVSSETQISNLMGAGRFTTALQLNVTELHRPEPLPAPPASAAAEETAGTAKAAQAASSASSSSSTALQLVYSVRCATSSIPWPMSATIENLMAEKALVSMQTFLDYCTQLLEEWTVSADAAVTAAVSDISVPPGSAAAPDKSAASAASVLAQPRPAAVAGAGPGSGAAAGTPVAPSPAPLSPPGGLASARTMGSLRHRWPSITCSQDIGPVGPGGAGEPFLLRRQDTLGGAETFWDAPETFAGAGSGSGVSSGVVSPRPSGLQSSTLRRLSADHAGAPAPGLGSTAPAAAVVAAETHQVAVNVDRLAAAVAALESKMDKLLALQAQQEERQLRLQQSVTAALGTAASRDAAAASRMQGRGGGGWARGRGAGRGGEDAGSASDTRWLLRIAIALLLATSLLLGFWALRPHATGYLPHGGSGGGAVGGGQALGDPVLFPSVVRVDGAEAGGARVSGAGQGVGAGMGVGLGAGGQRTAAGGHAGGEGAGQVGGVLGSGGGGNSRSLRGVRGRQQVVRQRRR